MDNDTTPPPPGDPRGPGGTSTATPPAPAGSTGPRVDSEDARDLARLRHSATERRVAGVCGGIARQLDIDPTVVRVVVAVLVFFGGAGLLVYLGAWLFVPDERTGRAAVHLDAGARSAALIVVGVLSAVTALGQGWGGPFGGWGGWWFLTPFPLLVLLTVGAVVWFSGRDRRAQATAVQTSAAASYAAPPASRRLLPAYTPPPVRKRTGPLLFWPTLAVIAVALGALGVYDAGGGTVADGGYAALALAVTGLGLLIGAFRGRPGGLVLLAIVCAVVTAGGVVAGAVPQAQQVTATPTTAAQVRPAYEIGNGELRLDLSQVTDPQSLDGRRITIDGRSGAVQVTLPEGVGARVDARIDLAGVIDVTGTDSTGGFTPRLDTDVDAPAGAPVVELDITTRLGAIDVRSTR